MTVDMDKPVASYSRELFLSSNFALFGPRVLANLARTWMRLIRHHAFWLFGPRQYYSIKVTIRAPADGVSVDPAKGRRNQPTSKPNGYDHAVGLAVCRCILFLLDEMGCPYARFDESRIVFCDFQDFQRHMSFTVQCLFAPSETCHLITGCPSKLWDKLIQHTHADHCADTRARTGTVHGPDETALLCAGRGRQESRLAWVSTVQPVSRRDLPAILRVIRRLCLPHRSITLDNMTGQQGKLRRQAGQTRQRTGRVLPFQFAPES